MTIKYTTKICNRCSTNYGSERDFILGKIISSNGGTHILAICSNCMKPLANMCNNVYNTIFIPKSHLEKLRVKIEDIPYAVSKDGKYTLQDELPIENSCIEYSCEVCGDPETEFHHFAPTHLFGVKDRNRWPTAYLCKKHHKEWHDKVTPNMCKKNAY